MKTIIIISAIVILLIAGFNYFIHLLDVAQRKRCEQYKQERLAEGVPEEIINMELSGPDFMF